MRKGLEKYEAYVQQKSALTKIGTDLMANAFNENSPVVKIADVASERGKGLQMGFKFVSMGAMSFLRWVRLLPLCSGFRRPPRKSRRR